MATGITPCTAKISKLYPELSEDEIADFILEMGEYRDVYSKEYANWSQEDLKFHRENRARGKLHMYKI